MNITSAHNVFRLQGTLAFMQDGPGPARILVYEGSQPAQPIDPPTGSTLLGTITLDDPPGSLIGGQLVLTASQVAVCVATGAPQWARLINGFDTPGGDMTASSVGGGGQVQVETTGGQVLLGGALALVSGAFT